MRKTTLEIDVTKVDKAKVVLGTKTLRETVDRALDEVLALHARRKLIEHLKTFDAQEVERLLREAWRE